MLNEILETLKQRQDDHSRNDTVNDIVKLINNNSYITFDQLAFKLNKSRRTIARMMKKMQSEGIIIRIGSDKTGYWKVLK